MMHPANRVARVRRAGLTVAATVSAVSLCAATSAYAQSELGDAQLDPNTETGLQVWENSQARSTDPLPGVPVTLISLQREGLKVHAKLSIRNDTPAPVTDMSLAVRSQAPVSSASSIRYAQLSNFGEYPQSSEQITVPGSIEPGQTKDISLSILGEGQPAEGADTDSAAQGERAQEENASDFSLTHPELFAPGAHPVMFSVNANAQLESQNQPVSQLVGVARSTLSVVPDEPRKPSPTPLTFIWPLAADTHALGGATGEAPERAPLYLANEELAAELGEGGRLRMLLDTYRDALNGPQGRDLKQASCVAIDPELLDTVQRMTSGYRVGSQRPSPVDKPRQLRDSWGEILGGSDLEYSEGTGANAATAWLEDLKELVAHGCSVALPYAGANLDTIAQTGEDWLAVHALRQGPQIIHRILGVWPTQNVVLPSSGSVSPDAAPLLRHAATQGANVDLDELYEQQLDPQKRKPERPRRSQTVTALVAANSLEPSSAPVPAPAASADPAALSDPDDANTSENPATPNPVAEGITPMPAVDLSNSIPRAPRTPVTTHALGYSADLAAALRATGTHPEIAGYTDPTKRYNVEADSPAARIADATAVLNEEISAGHSTLAVPPSLWTATESGARTFLDTISQALSSKRASATPLDALLQMRATPGNTRVPYTDPGAPSTDHVEHIAGHSRYLHRFTRVMRNDPQIALSREAFTRPLYDDLVRAASDYRMRERSAWSQVRDLIRQRVGAVGEVVDSLKQAVSLLPPGNVFTRTSASSPLLVVARNGLPLPVDATLQYSSEDGTDPGLTMPEGVQTIPARGSITLTLYSDANKPDTFDSATNLSLWLASPNNSKDNRDEHAGERISESVDIRVQSVPGVSGWTVGIIGVLLLALAIVGKTLWNRRSTGPKTPQREKLQRLRLEEN